MNTLEPVYYKVTIDGASFASNNDGFIDNTTPELYAKVSGFPSTRELSLLKESANFRWAEIVQQLSFNVSPILIGHVVKTGTPSSDEAPETITFTIGYDREEYVYTYDNETSPEVILTGEAAIKRLVARAMISNISPSNTYFYDPTIVGGNPQGPSIVSVGATALTNDITTAESAITVVKVEY